jgi:hypothetical protein
VSLEGGKRVPRARAPSFASKQNIYFYFSFLKNKSVIITLKIIIVRKKENYFSNYLLIQNEKNGKL